MIKKIGKTFELMISSDVLWGLNGSWDKKIHESILEEAIDLRSKGFLLRH